MTGHRGNVQEKTKLVDEVEEQNQFFTNVCFAPILLYLR